MKRLKESVEKKSVKLKVGQEVILEDGSRALIEEGDCLVEKKRVKAEIFAKKLGWKENTPEVEALRDVVDSKVNVGDASFFYGADSDVVMSFILNAQDLGIELI